MKDSLIVGAVAGAAGGTGVGIMVEPSAGSALIGTAVGAVIGGTLGYLMHEENNKKSTLLKEASKFRIDPEKLPSLAPPEASCMKIAGKVQGDKYLGPHVLCTIEKNSIWSLP